MKPSRLFATLLLCAAAAAHSASHAQTLKLGHGNAVGHPLDQGAARFAEIVQEKTGGKLKIKVYPGGQLGADAQMVTAVRSGVQDIAIPSTAPVGTVISQYLLFDLPFLFQNEKEADALLDGPIGTQLLKLAEEKDMVGLCYWENGFRQLTNSRRPVNTMQDIAGLKLRVMQNPVYIDAFKTLGANAIPMPFSELYSAMETRAIDAEENPISLIHANKFYEVQKYLALTNHAYAPYVVLVSRKKWQTLDDSGQQALREACVQARDYQRQLNRQVTADMLKQLQTEGGMQITTPDAAEIQKMRASLQAVIAKHTPQIGTELVQSAQKMLEAMR